MSIVQLDFYLLLEGASLVGSLVLYTLEMIPEPIKMVLCPGIPSVPRSVVA